MSLGNSFLTKIIFSFIAQIGATLGAFCHGGPKPDAPQNEMPILDSPPVFDREIKNAKLYWADSGTVFRLIYESLL